jgi:hypothetical protein
MFRVPILLFVLGRPDVGLGLNTALALGDGNGCIFIVSKAAVAATMIRAALAPNLYVGCLHQGRAGGGGCGRTAAIGR